MGAPGGVSALRDGAAAPQACAASKKAIRNSRGPGSERKVMRESPNEQITLSRADAYRGRAGRAWPRLPRSMPGEAADQRRRGGGPVHTLVGEHAVVEAEHWAEAELVAHPELVAHA